MRKRLFFLHCVVMILLLTIPSMVWADNYTGYLVEEGSGGSWSATAEIPLTLTTLTSLHIDGVSTDPCGSNPTQARLKRLQNDGSRTGVNVNLNLGNYILTEGNYIVEITCTRSQPPEPYTLSYALSTTQSLVQHAYMEDTEPDESPEGAAVLTQTRVMEGYLGADGYQLPAYHFDGSDTYFFKVEKNTTIRLKLEYDDSFKDNPALDQSGGSDLSVFLGIYNPEHGFPHNAWVPLDNWSQNGFVSEPINLYYNGGIGVPLTFGVIVSLGNGWHPPVGSYKLSILVEEPDPDPDPEDLFINILSAEWKTSSLGHGLVIKYRLKNTFNIAKTISPKAFIKAPLPWDTVYATLPDVTNSDFLYYDYTAWLPQEIEDAYNFVGDCQQDEGGEISVWKIFPHGCGPSGDNCVVLEIGLRQNSYSISPHTTEEHLAIIPITDNDYHRLAEGYQRYKVSFDSNGDGSSNLCAVGRLYYWPKRAIGGWILNLLLKHDAK